MKNKIKVVVVGSINMDLVISAPRIPSVGETIIGHNSFTAPGGKGANQAVAASRLGGQVEMIGCVGNDSFGTELLNTLKSEKVGVDNIDVIPETPTGKAFITISEDGDNSIVLAPGSNAKLTPTMVKQKEDVIKAADILLVQLEIPIETAEEAIRIAKNHQVKTILNPAPASALSDGILKDVDILTPNESEGKLLLHHNVETDIQPEEIVKGLKRLGPNKIALTQGADGVLFHDGHLLQHVPALNVKAVDTTGAGDSFNAALAIAYAGGRSFLDSIHFAQQVAARTITKYGAISSLPYYSEIAHGSDIA